MHDVSTARAARGVPSVPAALAIMALVGSCSSAAHSYARLLLLATASLLLLAVGLRRKIGERPELGFLALALICGSLLAVTLPRNYNSWDEKIHYQRAEQLAALVVDELPYRPETTTSSYSIEQQKLHDSSMDARYRTRRKMPTLKIVTYLSIGYLPSAFMIAIGNLVHLPHHVIFVLGRWINSVLYAVVVFLAIRKLKSGRMILSLIALFPTSVFLASSYNYDSWVTAFTMLGMAYLFSELQQPDKKVTVGEMCVMLGSLLIGLGPKAIYFPLFFLFFLMKPEKFPSPRHRTGFAAATAASILLVAGSFLLPFLLSDTKGGDIRGGPGVNGAGQLSYLLSNPVAYTKLLLSFIVGYVNPLKARDYMLFHAYLGKQSGFFPLLFTLVVAVVTDKSAHDGPATSLRVRLSVIGVVLATIALIATALYIDFTPVGLPQIRGVAARYLIPLLFPLLITLGSSRTALRINPNAYHAMGFFVAAFVLLLGIWEIDVRRYY